MYLAEHTIKGRKRYIIRDSWYNHEADCWQCRDLFDLGGSPWEFISYPGGNAFYIRESVGEQLTDLGIEYNISELEELFWRFIRKEIRQKIEPFYYRSIRRTRKKEAKENPAAGEVHVFDKRRIFYLRSGCVDQRRIMLLPPRYFKALRQKSRDEIEQYCLQLEKSLNVREFKQYVYVIFDLQRYYPGSSFRDFPQALDQDELDGHFIEDLCSLNRDQSFWAGFTYGKDRLHEYLVRYAVMYFDYEFDGNSAWQEYLQNFMNSRRFYRPPPPKETVAMAEVVEIFGETEETLKAMGKSDLTKLFRRKAHELHPDKGGEHDAFVRLSEAYKQLLQRKD